MEKGGPGMRSYAYEQGSTAIKQPDKVATILKMKRLGVRSKSIAKLLGIRKTSAKRYVDAEGWIEYREPERSRALNGHERWLCEQMRKHRNNAEVVRQEFARGKGIEVSLRTVERAVEGHRMLARV